MDMDLRAQVMLTRRAWDFAGDDRTGEDNFAPDWKMLLSSQPESVSSPTNPCPWHCAILWASLPAPSVCT